MSKINVKICCIGSKVEADLAIKYGASSLGLVGNMPSGPGVIDDVLIKDIARHTPSHISTFLLTSNTNAEDIIEHHKKTNTTTIQIVDALHKRAYNQIRNELPNVKLVQVIHVIDDTSISEAIDISQFVDTILLDSGNPNLNVKILGGTGKVHNWDLSKQIVEQVNIPVYLAGGLNASNVRKAIDYVQPSGVDLCSGVRTNGELDETKLADFFEAVRGKNSTQP